jgi:hypothetical protein
MTDFRSKPCNTGDYRYWVERSKTGTQAFREPIDKSHPKEPIDKLELPSQELIAQYDLLRAGGMPIVA